MWHRAGQIQASTGWKVGCTCLSLNANTAKQHGTEDKEQGLLPLVEMPDHTRMFIRPDIWCPGEGQGGTRKLLLSLLPSLTALILAYNLSSKSHLQRLVGRWVVYHELASKLKTFWMLILIPSGFKKKKKKRQMSNQSASNYWGPQAMLRVAFSGLIKPGQMDTWGLCLGLPQVKAAYII